jgi:hypothetical protein
LKSQGLRIPEEGRYKKDGDCWAAACAFAASQVGQFYSKEEVRELAVAYLERNCTEFMQFLEDSLTVDDFMEECKELKKPGTYTTNKSAIGDLLVGAFGLAVGLKFRVFTFGKAPDKERYESFNSYAGVEEAETVLPIALALNIPHYYGVVNLKSEGMSLNSIILFKCKIRYINQTTVCVQRMEVEKNLPRQLVQFLQQSQQEIWPSKWQIFHHHHHHHHYHHHQQSRRKSLKQKVRLQFYF